MNRSDLRSEIRRLIRDADTTNQKYDDTTINTRINQSQERIATLTQMIRTRVTTNIVVSTAEYDLPTTFLTEVNVTYLNSDSEWIPLVKKTESELDLEDSNWRNTTSSQPENYYIRRFKTGIKIGLVYTPDFSRSSALRIDHIRRPTEMDEDADIPFEGLPEFYPYHDIISIDVASRFMMDERDFKSVAELEARYGVLLEGIKGQVSSTSEETRIPNIYEIVRSAPRRTK